MIPFQAPFAYTFTSCSQVVEHRSVIWPLVFPWLVLPGFGECEFRGRTVAGTIGAICFSLVNRFFQMQPFS
jgi:hypothetical protein